MKKLFLAVALAAGLTAPAWASVQMDGALPMYPNAKLDPREDVPAAAIAKGVPLVQLTKDSVATVDAWYKSNAPKGCKRTAASAGVQYKCPGGSIQIYDRGGTQIALVPL
ncbi:MAG TPA: hypothetical protein VGF86_13680, partial [Candidatus Tumulicola sp.]